MRKDTVILMGLLLILPIVLSLGAINAFIPVIIIVILIAAAASSTRGFNMFAVFGIGTLAGQRIAGRGSFAGRGSYPFRGILEGHIKPNVKKAKAAKILMEKPPKEGEMAAQITKKKMTPKERAIRYGRFASPIGAGAAALGMDIGGWATNTVREGKGKRTSRTELKHARAVQEKMGGYHPETGKYVEGSVDREVRAYLAYTKLGMTKSAERHRAAAIAQLSRIHLVETGREQGRVPASSGIGSLMRAGIAGIKGNKEEAKWHIANARSKYADVLGFTGGVSVGGVAGWTERRVVVTERVDRETQEAERKEAERIASIGKGGTFKERVKEGFRKGTQEEDKNLVLIPVDWKIIRIGGKVPLPVPFVRAEDLGGTAVWAGRRIEGMLSPVVWPARKFVQFKKERKITEQGRSLWERTFEDRPTWLVRNKINEKTGEEEPGAFEAMLEAKRERKHEGEMYDYKVYSDRRL
jgi:hypothetical protein